MPRQSLSLPLVAFVFATVLSGAVTFGFWKLGDLAAADPAVAVASR